MAIRSSDSAPSSAAMPAWFAPGRFRTRRVRDRGAAIAAAISPLTLATRQAAFEHRETIDIHRDARDRRVPAAA